MPSKSNRPEPFPAYPASPPTDDAVSLISTRSHTSRSTSQSNVGPEQGDYRLHLGRRNVEIQTRFPPEAIVANAMAIWTRDRSSPPMTDEAAARVRQNLRDCADSRESDLRLNIESDLLPPSLPPRVSSATEAEWRHHARLPMDAVWNGVTPELTWPQPDVAWHLDNKSLSTTQQVAIEKLQDANGKKYFMPAAAQGPPFFSVEFVSQAKSSGTLWKALNQGTYSSAQCLNAIYQLEKTIGEKAPGDGAYFLHFQMDQGFAQLSVSWMEVDSSKSLRFYSDVLRRFILSNEDSLQTLVEVVRGLRNCRDRLAEEFSERLTVALDRYYDMIANHAPLQYAVTERLGIKRSCPSHQSPSSKRSALEHVDGDREAQQSISSTYATRQASTVTHAGNTYESTPSSFNQSPALGQPTGSASNLYSSQQAPTSTHSRWEEGGRKSSQPQQ